MTPIRIFVSSVQREFAEELAALLFWNGADDLLSVDKVWIPGCAIMAYWTIPLQREDATIIIRGEGDDPHAPDRIDFFCNSHLNARGYRKKANTIDQSLPELVEDDRFLRW